jgi:hypothetical protein
LRQSPFTREIKRLLRSTVVHQSVVECEARITAWRIGDGAPQTGLRHIHILRQDLHSAAQLWTLRAKDVHPPRRTPKAPKSPSMVSQALHL